MREIQLKRVYRHFKGDYYLVEDVAHDSETGAPVVVYRKLYGDGGLWVRPPELLLREVARTHSPNCTQQYRLDLQEIKSVKEQ